MTICETGIPIVIDRSTIIARRFCKKDWMLDSPWTKSNKYLTPSSSHSDMVETANDAKRASRQRDANTNFEMNS